MRCEKCGRETPVAEPSWIHIEVYEGGTPEAARTLDFCGLCKLFVNKTLRGLAPKAETSW